MRRARRWIGPQPQLLLYSMQLGEVGKGEDAGLVRRDGLPDLLAYRASEPWPSRQTFLATALTRLEDGMHAYTHVQNGRLLTCGWLAERQEKLSLCGGGIDYPLPPGSAYLFDFYTAAELHDRELLAATLRRMIRDAARVPDTRNIYITVSSDDRLVRGVMETAGFVCECSLTESCVAKATVGERRGISPPVEALPAGLRRAARQ
jgi:hypothetical protein